MSDDVTSAITDEGTPVTPTDNSMVFPTFFHINDYNEAGYADLPRYVATSYPLVVWGPSGRLLARCYKDEDNACTISPEQFIKLVEANHIQVIGREEWFNKTWRNNHRWEDAHWVDGFDDNLLGIMRERQGAPLSSQSVRIVEKEDGYEWAENYLAEKSSTIDTIIKLIQETKVPQGVQEKSASNLGKGNHRQAVKDVLRDLRNHVQAKNLAHAKVPFLSQKDADFFSLIEAEGEIVEVQKELVISADMGRAIIELVERLTQPEHVVSLDGFLGSNLHIELVSWFSHATDLANTFLPRNFCHSLSELLMEYAAKGRFSESLTKRFRQQCPLFAPVTEADDLLTWLICEIIDSDDTLGTSGLYIGDMPMVGDFLEKVGMATPANEKQGFCPHIANNDRATLLEPVHG